jgi:hypothetical protein
MMPAARRSGGLIGPPSARFAVGWQLGPGVRVMETAYLEYLHAERLEPGEKPLQGRLIPERAMQDRFDGLH